MTDQQRSITDPAVHFSTPKRLAFLAHCFGFLSGNFTVFVNLLIPLGTSLLPGMSDAVFFRLASTASQSPEEPMLNSTADIYVYNLVQQRFGSL